MGQGLDVGPFGRDGISGPLRYKPAPSFTSPQPVPATEPKVERVLQEADRLITGEKREDYGPVRESFARVARGWSEVLGMEVTPAQVALCMIWMKISRELERPKRDNRVDMAGYAGLLDEIQ